MARSHRIRTVALCLLASVLFAAGTIDRGRGQTGIDFYHYWVVPQHLARSPGVDIYDVDQHRSLTESLGAEAVRAGGRRADAGRSWGLIDPTGTPLFYALVGLLWSGDYEHDYWRFQALSTIAFIAALAIFATLLRLPVGVVMVGAAALAFWFRPFVIEVQVANAQRLLLLGLAAYAGLRALPPSRLTQIASGFIITTLVLFKPVVAPCAVLVVLSDIVGGDRIRWRREAIGAAGATVAGFALSTIVHGRWTSWLDWVAFLSAKIGDYRIAAGNSGLTPLIERATGMELSLAIGAAVGIAGVALTVRATRSSLRRSLVTIHALSLGSIAVLIGADLAWIIYFLLAVIPLLSLFALPSADQPPRAWHTWRTALAPIPLLLIGVDFLRGPLRLEEPFDTAWCSALGALVLALIIAADILLAPRPSAPSVAAAVERP